MDSLIQDLRFAFRTLLRSPGVTAVAALSLALGIGVNTSMFSVVNAALLKPFPYSAPNELVSIWGRFLPSSGYDFPYFALSDPEALDLTRAAGGGFSLASVAAYRWGTVNLGGPDGEPERVWAIRVPAEFFSVLGVGAALGRTFLPEETQEASPASSCSTVVSYETWIDRLGGSPEAVGSSISVDDARCLVLGVMPESFFFVSRRVKLFLPLTLDPNPEARGSHSVGSVGRLAPGVSLEEARAEMDALMGSWAKEFPDHHAQGHFLILDPFHKDQVRSVRPALLVLMGAVGLVLLIVCSNVGSLLLGRAEARRGEMALRTSLGAGRGRLVRQLLTESLLLASLAGSLGLLVSAWSLEAVLALYPQRIPGAGEARIEGAVLPFTMALSLGSVVLFGLAPALSMASLRPRDVLRTEGRASSGAPRRVTIQRALVVLEIGLSLMLLVGAGLLLRSFHRLQDVPLGFDPGGVLTFSLNASPRTSPDPSAVRQLYSDLLVRIGGLPGVESIGLISSLPLGEGAPPDDFLVENRPEPEPGETGSNADYLMVSPGVFAALRIPLRRGRLLTSGDAEGAPLVAVINETASRRYWPNEDPLGQRIRYYGDDAPWITIVGIVGDVRSTTLEREPRPAVYAPHGQASRGPAFDRNGTARSVALLIRARRSPEELSGPVRAVIRERDASLPLSSPMTMEEVVSRSAAERKFTALLMGTFAGTALFLALVGVYGIVSYFVEQTRHAIGIRMALGATTGDVLRLVLRQGMHLGAVGIGFGLTASLLLSRFLEGVLYGVDPLDPMTFVSLTAALGAVVVLASYLPARRVARLDVSETLRSG